jgi:hypothetical protein
MVSCLQGLISEKSIQMVSTTCWLNVYYSLVLTYLHVKAIFRAWNTGDEDAEANYSASFFISKTHIVIAAIHLFYEQQ